MKILFLKQCYCEFSWGKIEEMNAIYNPNMKSLLMDNKDILKKLSLICCLRVGFTMCFSLLCFLFTGLVGGLNKQIWHVKRVSNVARSLHERPSTERPDHRCTYQVSSLNMHDKSPTCQWAFLNILRASKVLSV